jgi:hypothetical protein
MFVIFKAKKKRMFRVEYVGMFMTEWDGDKYLDLYSGGDRLEVLPGHRLS